MRHPNNSMIKTDQKSDNQLENNIK